MNDMRVAARPELCSATDEQIEDAIAFADPMMLRGLLYQLTGDADVAAIEVKPVLRGYYELAAPVHAEDVASLRRKAADFLKSYRDAGAGPIDIGPADRLP